MPPAPRVLVMGLNYPPEPTGISPYTGALARGLGRRGFVTRVLTTHPHYPDWAISPGYGQWARTELHEGVEIVRLRHYVPARPHGLHRLASEWSFGARLRAARWGRPDAIVAVSPALVSTAMASVRARWMHRRTPFIVWVQDLYTVGMAETGAAGKTAVRVMSGIERWTLRRADRVVVIHDRFAQRLHEDFGVPMEKIAVIRNWTHLSDAEEVDTSGVRNQLGWSPDETVVLHAGNMGVKQGLDNVIQAARLVDGGEQSIRFVLLGSGSERERLMRSADGVESVQFLSHLDDAQFAAALASADVLLVNELAGVSEMAVPSKLTSYFSASRPVVAATDVNGITADEVRSANAGLVVPAGDPEALLAAVRRLAEDRGAASELGANGRAYRETVLNEDTAISAFADMLDELLNPNGAVGTEHTDGPAVATSPRN